MEHWWKNRWVKRVSWPIVLNIFFSFEGNYERAAENNLWYFLSMCPNVCGYEDTKKKGKRWGKAVCRCISLYVRGSFSNPQRQNICFLSVLVFQGGLKAILKWHLLSRTTWTQSAAVRPKWTTGEFLWERKLNANHTNNWHSHTSVRCFHMVRGIRTTRIWHWLYLWKDNKPTESGWLRYAAATDARSL